MFRSTRLVILALSLLPVLAARAGPGQYGLGTSAVQAQIAGWDIDVRPDGTGLPPGSGSAEQGEPMYEHKCASCHGVFGEGMGRWPVLAGGRGTLTHDRPEKTVGSYWPFVSTLWDYIHRAMPFLEPQSLSDDEVYALTAYVLYLNELVSKDFVLTRDNLANIHLPNEQAFVNDPRPDVVNPRCMENCKDPESIRITWDSTELDVTPDTDLQPAQKGQRENIAGGAEIYAGSCAVCHDGGAGGAPRTGQAQDWTGRISQGMNILVDHAVNGYQGDAGVMPAKGGNAGLADEQVRAAVVYMIQLVD